MHVLSVPDDIPLDIGQDDLSQKPCFEIFAVKIFWIRFPGPSIATVV